MEKMMLMRSLCRSIVRRSQIFSSSAAAAGTAVRRLHFSSAPLPASSPNQNRMPPFGLRLGGTRSFSVEVSQMPDIKDPDVKNAFKDLMAAYWDELPPAVHEDVKKALTKNSDDKASQEALKNVFRAAEAVEEFSAMVISLKMELDDAIGATGEDVKPLSDEYINALKTIFNRYNAYLASFGPDEIYLKKKVEMELGSKMIHLKMRCAGLDATWGKVTVLGTSGLSGSYIEQRS
ncbi:succinate dehydrogenase subunit 5, mitochondrial [Andrographis paniculata]|uniref:succinate dehydrogenase subunit 5, mitochondrial n=1 Tax=Andrographis paniculata TaxID=175694 RepID=UPI0021E76A0E|nr:succinate dehydrogenase subunit 5, mitochondrial [Andrographis paniculata]